MILTRLCSLFHCFSPFLLQSFNEVNQASQNCISYCNVEFCINTEDFYVCSRSKDSMYHALGYSTILVMQAAMTFEQQDIQMGISTMKEALQTCQR